MARSFTRATLRLMGSLLVWLASFTVIYVLGAVSCARGDAGLQSAGFGVFGLLTMLIVLAAGAFALWQIVRATRQVRAGAPEGKFGAFLALSLGGLVLFGLLLLLLPSLVVQPSCTGQPALTSGSRTSSLQEVNPD